MASSSKKEEDSVGIRTGSHVGSYVGHDACDDRWGGDAMLHADEPWHIIIMALNLEPYLLVGDAWPILDLAASALLPGYAFAQVVNAFTLTAADNITDTGSLELDGANDIATFEENGSRYAVVTAHHDNGVQILDITDPTSITAVSQIIDNNTDCELNGVRQIAIYESETNCYAAITGSADNSVQILDIANPDTITAAGSIGNSTTLLNGAWGINVFESENRHYAAVVAYGDDAVQILDIANPDTITSKSEILTIIGVEI